MCMPPFTIANITNYFISRIACDGKPANDFKNLNSHAYPLFKAGHIQSISYCCKDTFHVIRCTCLPEMRKGTVYNVNVTLDITGDIIEANCLVQVLLGVVNILQLCVTVWKSLTGLNSFVHLSHACHGSSSGINHASGSLNPAMLMISHL